MGSPLADSLMHKAWRTTGPTCLRYTGRSEGYWCLAAWPAKVEINPEKEDFYVKIPSGVCFRVVQVDRWTSIEGKSLDVGVELLSRVDVANATECHGVVDGSWAPSSPDKCPIVPKNVKLIVTDFFSISDDDNRPAAIRRPAMFELLLEPSKKATIEEMCLKDAEK